MLSVDIIFSLEAHKAYIEIYVVARTAEIITLLRTDVAGDHNWYRSWGVKRWKMTWNINLIVLARFTGEHICASYSYRSLHLAVPILGGLS